MPTVTCDFGHRWLTFVRCGMCQETFLAICRAHRDDDRAAFAGVGAHSLNFVESGEEGAFPEVHAEVNAVGDTHPDSVPWGRELRENAGKYMMNYM
jgi:hypothetical protein